MDMQQLFETIDQLEPDQLQQLQSYIAQRQYSPPVTFVRKLNLHRGVMQTSDDFDDPLPDAFWLGEE